MNVLSEIAVITDINFDSVKYLYFAYCKSFNSKFLIQNEKQLQNYTFSYPYNDGFELNVNLNPVIFLNNS